MEGHGGDVYGRAVCDIEAGLSGLARCLPNTVKVHVNYRINLDSVDLGMRVCVCVYMYALPLVDATRAA